MEFIEHGVKEGKRPEDYVAGEFSFVGFEDRNPSGDWTSYLPTKEFQKGREDSMSCVSFSAINSIEMQEKFLTGIENNYSDRWLAVMSETTQDGNYLYKVADTIRKYGLVKESSFPAPANFTFAAYHAKPEPSLQKELEAEGQEWLKKWDLKYEWIPVSKELLVKNIKQAPLQITKPGHAIVDFICLEDIVKYFDTYNPFIKDLAYANVTASLKILLTPKEMAKKFIVNDGGKIGVAVIEGFTGTIVFAKTPEALADLKLALEIPDDAPTFNYPQ